MKKQRDPEPHDQPDGEWPLQCRTCGTPLGRDDEDEPEGDAGGPICGECNRARNCDVMFGR